MSDLVQKSESGHAEIALPSWLLECHLSGAEFAVLATLFSLYNGLEAEVVIRWLQTAEERSPGSGKAAVKSLKHRGVLNLEERGSGVVIGINLQDLRERSKEVRS